MELREPVKKKRVENSTLGSEPPTAESVENFQKRVWKMTRSEPSPPQVWNFPLFYGFPNTCMSLIYFVID